MKYQIPHSASSLSAYFFQEISRRSHSVQIYRESLIPPDSLSENALQNISGKNSQTNLSADLAFKTTLFKSLQLEFIYHINVVNSFTVQSTKLSDLSANAANMKDSLSQSIYLNNNINQSFRIDLQQKIGAKLLLNGGLGFQTSILKGNDKATEVRQVFNTILPTIMLTYKPTKSQSVKLNFRVVTNDPTTRQIQNIIDYSNPLLIYAGNPSIKQQKSYLAGLNYTLITRTRYHTLMSGLNFTAISGRISNLTFVNTSKDAVEIDGIVVAPGVQLIKPSNMNGYKKNGAYLNATFNLRKSAKIFSNTAWSSVREIFFINGISGNTEK
ncbi:MAG: hypothetical protein EOP48_34715, partial [Sphingobacteriales bacterium]